MRFLQNAKQIQPKVSKTICHGWRSHCLAALMLLLCLLPLVSIAEYATPSAWAAPIYAASEQWEQEKGEWQFWSYADKATFCEQYGAYPYQSNPSDTGVTELYVMPGAEDTPYEVAVSIAKQAVVEYLGEKAETLDHLLIASYFRRSYWPMQDGKRSDAWILQFCQTTGKRHPLYDAVIFSPSGQVLTVMERDVEREMEGSARLRQWSSHSLQMDSNLPATLYYNPDGGQYYHYDANCPSVSKKYLPLEPFDSSMIQMRPQYSVLLNCPVCIK